MKSLCFHNWGRKGDLHVSRSFVKKIAAHVDVPCYYYHAEDPGILADVPVQHLPRTQLENKKFAYTTTFVEDGHVYFNTWYGAGKHKYRSASADDLITFDTLYRLFRAGCAEKLDLRLGELGPIHSFLPRIDWTAYAATSTARDRLNAIAKSKRVFFDTVNCLSGQANNFPLVPVLRNVALRRPKVTFFYTWAPSSVRASLPRNCIWTRDVHGVKPGTVDLNENAFISTYCQVIVGRNSSSYTFAQCYENMIERPTHFVEFSQLPYPLLLGPMWIDRLKHKCVLTHSQTASRNEAIKLVLAAVDSARAS